MNVDEYMNKAEEAFEFAEKSGGSEDNAKMAHALESIAASMIAANELEYLKVSMMQKEHETQSSPVATIKTVGGKEIQL